jgi:5-formyltetrahydrofolate cyclo-ligase
LKSNPDSPQRAIRHKALAEGKIVYMAVPRLRNQQPFIELDPAKLNCSLYVASSIKGATKAGRFVGLDEVKNRPDRLRLGRRQLRRRSSR